MSTLFQALTTRLPDEPFSLAVILLGINMSMPPRIVVIIWLLLLAAGVASMYLAGKCADRIVVYCIYGIPRARAERLYVADSYRERLIISNGDTFGLYWARVHGWVSVVSFMDITSVIIAVALKFVFSAFPPLKRELAKLSR